MPDIIYCPRCAERANDNVAFCRKCGLPLDEVIAIVSGDAPNSPETTTRPNFNMIRIGVGLFILGTVLGLANVIARDLQLFPDIYGKAIFLSVIIAGLLSIGSSFLFPVKVYKKRKQSTEPDSRNALNTGPLGARLPAAEITEAEISVTKEAREKTPASPSSVTENTTRQLG